MSVVMEKYSAFLTDYAILPLRTELVWPSWLIITGTELGILHQVYSVS